MKNVVDGGGAHAPRALRKRIMLVLLVSAAILMIPAIAMQFTSEMNWGPGDFAVAAILLVGAGLCYVGMACKVATKGWRIAIGLGVAFALLTVWVELAVGIFH